MSIPNPFDIAVALARHYGRLAEQMCECRASGDREPLDLSSHSPNDCAYRRFVESEDD